MTRIDTLSPSLFAGLIGYAASDSGVGFWIGAVGSWFMLTALVVIAAGLADGASSRSRHGAAMPEFEFAE